LDCGDLYEIAKRFAYENPEAMSDLLSALVESTAEYLIGQAKAGANVLKIFESWAEGLAPDLFDRLVINPTRDIISIIRAAGIEVPIMGFPRGSGLNAIRYAHETGITAIAAGTQMPMDDFRATLPEGMPVQGNLDPRIIFGGKSRTMFDILYPWLKAFHLIAVIFWMAGLLYLPRLF